MVEVIRKDYPARNWTDRRGKEHYNPAHYYCQYLYKGREIAYYESKDDVLCLNGDYLDNHYKDKTYNRALNGSYSRVYKYLFEMLKVDESTKLSEYFNLSF